MDFYPMQLYLAAASKFRGIASIPELSSTSDGLAPQQRRPGAKLKTRKYKLDDDRIKKVKDSIERTVCHMLGIQHPDHIVEQDGSSSTAETNIENIGSFRIESSDEDRIVISFLDPA